MIELASEHLPSLIPTIRWANQSQTREVLCKQSSSVLFPDENANPLDTKSAFLELFANISRRPRIFDGHKRESYIPERAWFPRRTW